MSAAQGEHTADRGVAPRSVGRGLMQPASLAVIVAFAAVGAALPLAFDHGGAVARTSRAAQVALVPRGAGAAQVAPAIGPHAGDVPGESAVTPVSSDGLAASGVLAAATIADSGLPTGGAAAPSSPAPAAPAQHQPAPAPAPSPSPSPAPALTLQEPTPLGTAGASVAGPATDPSSVTLTAPAVGSTTVSNPLPSAPALP